MSVVFLPSLYFHHFGHLLTETITTSFCEEILAQSAEEYLAEGLWTDEAVSVSR